MPLADDQQASRAAEFPRRALTKPYVRLADSCGSQHPTVSASSRAARRVSQLLHQEARRSYDAGLSEAIRRSPVQIKLHEESGWRTVWQRNPEIDRVLPGNGISST
jgi:hypothetical protein